MCWAHPVPSPPPFALCASSPVPSLQYDVINIGKDGIGAVSSSGQGSLWRVEALKGRSPDGKTGVDAKDLNLVGHELGFRAEMLIEDTHTSIELFRQVGDCASACLLRPRKTAGGQFLLCFASPSFSS